MRLARHCGFAVDTRHHPTDVTWSHDVVQAYDMQFIPESGFACLAPLPRAWELGVALRLQWPCCTTTLFVYDAG